jgi:lactate permease
MTWLQVYDPMRSVVLSTLLAAVPVVVLLGSLAFLKMQAHLAALLGLASAIAVATLVFGMPVSLAAATAVYGAAYGLLPIGWIILNVIFLYQLTHDRGLFAILRGSITTVTRDRRLQLLLVAFCFGAFFEGASGFGTPVAVTGAILIGLGFSPIQASGLSLIANTAPVAFGALGTPILALQTVTDLDLKSLSAMVGRQLPVFSVIVPFWLVWAFAGFRGTWSVWPAVFVAGVSFAVPQFLISNYHGPWLVDVASSVISLGALVLFLRFWQPRSSSAWLMPAEGSGAWSDAAAGRANTAADRASEIAGASASASASASPPEVRTPGQAHSRAEIVRAWVPWLILSVIVFLWGLPQVKTWLDGLSIVRMPVAGLHNLISRVPPVVPTVRPEPAIFLFNWLSATGSGILLAALIAGAVMRYSPIEMLRTYWRTLVLVRYSLVTISAMMAIGYITRYSGLDATLGLAFARTGVLYPFCGTLLGWLGVALTGSDTSSNVLFGSLQRITAQQLGLSPLLMAAANSSGGVMGKMIDAQSIVVASTATRYYGHEGEILRFVFFHSIALACLVGLLVMLQAYVVPFSQMVVH